jgi:transposase
MAHRQFKLTERERTSFRQAEARTDKASTLKRLQAVRLYGEGRPVQEIQEIAGCSWRSLMEWCQRYREEGMRGLVDKREGGNRARLTRVQRQEIGEKLRQYRPDQVLPTEMRVSQGVFWTVSDLKRAVQMWYGVTYQSPTSYLTLLHECRFSQQKPEKRYRSRPGEETVAEFEARLEKK